ncbi:MAG: ATP-dependent DNA helicase RecG [Lachnospiraceae bacterium]|nr:ATP-dependent DNA helicase RecG [Lachnospiraceae bacterium]
MGLRDIKGIGEKTEKLFAKVGVESVRDLIHYYPHTYDRYEEPAAIGALKTEEKAAVFGVITRTVDVKPIRNLKVITTTIQDPTGTLTLTWFNMPFLRNTLKRGTRYIFRGRVIQKQSRKVMEQPEIFTMAAYEEKLHSMQPVYGLTKGLGNKLVSKSVTQALSAMGPGKEYLPEDIRRRYRLADYDVAIRHIHYPRNMEELVEARHRLIFDEFLLFLLSMQRLKETKDTLPNAFPMKRVWTTEDVIENLPYELTGAQKNVWHQIELDLKGHALMCRLVQGDVGSGKTILAFLAMIMTAENGYQSALMVPTEVLAQQHYKGFARLLREQGLEEKIRPVLLTGSTTAKERREIYEHIADGQIQVIIGTHALIQEKVVYDRLALVITDEQHRFGVRQREALTQKGEVPNVLVMSATPIPRTLAIILYGDLDISVLDELPAKRLPIKNCVVSPAYRRKAYEFMIKQVSEGRQVYVICPMVEANEEIEAENVEDYTNMLRKQLPADIRVQMLHGQMTPAQKNDIMQSFEANEIQVLVSTTVVEVGVDVPNATLMMIENAERFGLAQLHQLRGRVGRGDHQSYCIFVQGKEGEKTAKRLDILNHSNDGFYIAGEDLKLRGPGDFFGIRQSGDMEFALADIYQDASVLKEASEAASLFAEELGDFYERNSKTIRGSQNI